MRSCQMTRIVALRRAKRRKRGTMPGDHRGQETHSPWFVFLCMVDCDIQYVLFVDYEYLAAGNISFSVHLYSSCSWFFFLFDGQTFTFLGGIFAQWPVLSMSCSVLAGCFAREQAAGDPESPSPLLLGARSAKDPAAGQKTHLLLLGHATCP